MPPESADSEDVLSRLPPAPAASQPIETVIEASSGWPRLGLAELWRYRDLVVNLTLRNIKVRYKQTVLGVLWAVLQPVLMMAVFWLIFSRGGQAVGGDIPYPIFVFAGLLPWMFFQTAVTTAANSVVSAEGLVTKVYFPRLAIPLSFVLASLVDLAVAFVVLVALMLWYRIAPTAAILLIPAAVLLLGLAAMGVGTLIAALTVSYRDFRHTIGFLLQIWMLMTVTIYNPSETSRAEPPTVAVVGGTTEIERGQTESPHPAYRIIGRLARLNPISAPVDFFRAATLGRPIAWGGVAGATVVNLVLCWIGMIYFRRVEDSFADVI